MCENYECEPYEGEAYQYWQKISGLKEKLALLKRVSVPALNRAARTLLDLCKTWDNSTKGERKYLVHIMIQEFGVNEIVKRILWAQARLDYESLFSILDGMRLDSDRRFRILRLEAQENNGDIQADAVQIGTGVEIRL